MLIASSSVIPSDGSTPVVFLGRPNARLTWALVGNGTLTQVDDFADSRGVGKALFTPSEGGQIVTVEVSYAV